MDLKGTVPESWLCVDCGFNTAPGFLNRVELEKAFEADVQGQGVAQRADDRSEIYSVRVAVWKAAGIEPHGGCLCIGCLEKRLGRKLKPKDFLRNHSFNSLPGSPRLIIRREELPPDFAAALREFYGAD
jgi:hypothetical protein